MGLRRPPHQSGPPAHRHWLHQAPAVPDQGCGQSHRRGTPDSPLLHPVNLQNIPAELRARKQWVLFRVEGGKKFPMSVAGPPASSTDPATWSSWEEVESRVDPPVMWPAFCFTQDDPYVFIDIDGVKPRAGETEEDYRTRATNAQGIMRQLLENFPGYQEQSASGNGLHIIAKGHVGP